MSEEYPSPVAWEIRERGGREAAMTNYALVQDNITNNIDKNQTITQSFQQNFVLHQKIRWIPTRKLEILSFTLDNT